MTNLEKEYLYLCQLVFNDSKESIIEEIKEAGGIVRIDESGDYIYYGADDSTYVFDEVRFFDALVYKKVLEPISHPTEEDIDKPNFTTDFKKFVIARRKSLDTYLEKLRRDISAGLIAA